MRVIPWDHVGQQTKEVNITFLVTFALNSLANVQFLNFCFSSMSFQLISSSLCPYVVFYL